MKLKIWSWPLGKWYFWLVVVVWMLGSLYYAPPEVRGDLTTILIAFFTTSIATYVPFAIGRLCYVKGYKKGVRSKDH